MNFLQVDMSPPSIDSAVVQDGLQVHDISYHHDPFIISANWHGFMDRVSGIHHHVWCAGTRYGADDIVPCRNTSLQEIDIMELSEPLTPG